MKKILLILLAIFTVTACLDDDSTNFRYEYLPIDDIITPASFTFGKVDSITVKYTLPSGCYSFSNLYYEYQDTTRIVAINALVNLDDACTQSTIEGQYKFPVEALQEEDYLFKFYKGKDNDGKSVFQEVVVPVN